jgi:hypothetical protein
MSILEHDSEIRQALETADSIGWDSCHKIYILADQQQTDKMKDYGYTYLWTKDQMDSDSMLNTIVQWWQDSCGLRFIEQVSTGDYNEPVFTSIISQFEEDED